jgi:hypothetical protein
MISEYIKKRITTVNRFGVFGPADGEVMLQQNAVARKKRQQLLRN